MTEADKHRGAKCEEKSNRLCRFEIQSLRKKRWCSALNPQAEGFDLQRHWRRRKPKEEKKTAPLGQTDS